MIKTLAAFSLISFATLAFGATEVSHTRYRDETARAEYAWIDGCISKQLTVTGSNTKLKEDGSVDSGSSLTVSYSAYNFCDYNNPEQTFWWGKTSSAFVQVAGNLKSGRISTPSFALSGTLVRTGVATDLGTKNFSVDLNWSSNDPLDKYAGTIVTQFPVFQEINHLTGHYRTANLAGTISDGATNLIPATADSIFVQLYRLNQGDTTLTKD